MKRREKCGKYKAAIINLGCKVNKYEADSMKDKLLMAGYDIVEPEEKADVYIVNTCSVTNMAQKKSRQMLRRAKKMNPEAVIVAAGCYVNAEHDTLKEESFVDVVVSNNCKKDIVAVITEYMENKSSGDYYIDINRTKEYEEMGSLQAACMNHQRAYIKIQDGCNQFCSYCIIPFTRGRVRSRKADQILAEIRKLAGEGVKEFVLTGIHISSYGIDLREKESQYDEVMENKSSMQKNGTPGESNPEDTISETTQEITELGQLVKAIAEIPEVERIRLGSLEPRIITDAFLMELSKSQKFCPHFHLSLQSACNSTLKRMNRKYTIEEFIEKCRMIREAFDMPAITTDVIVGFPGETEEEFATTMENLTRLGLYEIHVFKYSVRAGTVAEKLPDQVPEKIKGERSEALLALTARQKEEYEQAMKGYMDEVLFEECLDTGKEDLKEVELINEEGEISKSFLLADGSSKYFTGHTKRYVKVKMLANDDVINKVVRVKFV